MAIINFKNWRLPGRQYAWRADPRILRSFQAGLHTAILLDADNHVLCSEI